MADNPIIPPVNQEAPAANQELYEKYDISFLKNQYTNDIVLSNFNKSNLPPGTTAQGTVIAKISPAADPTNPEKYEITDQKSDEKIKGLLAGLQQIAPVVPVKKGFFWNNGGKKPTKRARYMKKGGKSKKRRTSRK
jgi:hypothetical protein